MNSRDLLPIGTKPDASPHDVTVEASPPNAASDLVKVVGPEEVIFQWATQACEPSDLPDIPARAFRDAQDRVHLIASHHTNRQMIGPNLNQVTHNCTPIMHSHDDPDPSRFDSREWIHAVYTTDGMTVYALVHNEYQGHRYADQCPSDKYVQCWFNAITLAVSHDGGDTFTHAEPPNHLVVSIPYQYPSDSGPAGSYSPSNIVRHPTDGFYYTLIHLEGYRDQKSGTCVMRTHDLADPRSWRAWDGAGFNVQFINPYQISPTRIHDHVCQPIDPGNIQNMSQSLTFNTHYNRFLLVGLAHEADPDTGERKWGIYYTMSDDLINWTPRRLLMGVTTPTSYECGDTSPIAYPSLLDPDSPSRNFETTGKRAYLYFTRFNYILCRQSPNRDLIRVPIEFP